MAKLRNELARKISKQTRQIVRDTIANPSKVVNNKPGTASLKMTFICKYK